MSMKMAGLTIKEFSPTKPMDIVRGKRLKRMYLNIIMSLDFSSLQIKCVMLERYTFNLK